MRRYGKEDLGNEPGIAGCRQHANEEIQKRIFGNLTRANPKPGKHVAKGMKRA